jgi:predicted DNA-binding transcriptional regulator AlpA
MAENSRLPSADEIAAMTPDEAEAALVAATSLLPLLVAKAREPRSSDGPEWMTVSEASLMTGMSRFFLYDHWKELSFCRKIGRSVKVNRRGLRQWLERKKAA